MEQAAVKTLPYMVVALGSLEIGTEGDRRRGRRKHMTEEGREA